VASRPSAASAAVRTTATKTFEDQSAGEELLVHAQREDKQVVAHDAHAEIKRDHHLTISDSHWVSCFPTAWYAPTPREGRFS